MRKMAEFSKWFLLFVIVSFVVSVSVFYGEQKEETKKEDEIIAEFNGGKVMRSEINESMMRFGGPAEFNSLGVPEKEGVIKEMALSKILHSQGLNEGLKDKEEFKQAFERWEQRELGRLLYEEVISSKVAVTDDVVKKYFDEHSDEFKQDLSFTMRHIFLSTYKEYKVQKGDTLYAIAKNISGDSDVAKRILDKDKNEIDLKKPVKVGDLLYVPINNEEKSVVKKKIEEVKAKLNAGEDFVKLAKEYSESEASKKGEVIGPLPVPNAPKPLLSEIREVAMKTDVGKYSDIIETKHGFQIIKIESKTLPGMKSFENVKPLVENKLKREQMAKLEKEYIDKLLTGPNVTSNFDILKNEKVKDDDMIFKIGDFVYTKKDFDKGLEALSPRRKDQVVTPDDKINFAKSVLLQKAIIANAKENKLEQKDTYKNDYEKFEINAISNLMIKKLVDDQVKIGESEPKEYYEKNKEQYKIPKMVDVDVIVKNLPIGPQPSEEVRKANEEKVVNKLKELRDKIVKGEAKFEEIAEKESEDPSSKNKGKLGLINPAIKGNEFKDAMDKMKIGDISEPIKYAFNYAIVRLNKIEAEKIKPFDEVKSMVESTVRMQKRSAMKKELDEKLLKENNFKILIPLVEPSPEDLKNPPQEKKVEEKKK